MSPTHAPARRTRPPIQSALWLWACVSAGAHVALLLGTGMRGAGLVAGAGTPWGDGFGGNAVELEIAGPSDEAPQGSISAGRHPEVTAVPEESAEPEPEREAVLQGELPVRAEPPAEPSPERAEAREPRRPAAPAHEAREPIPARDGNERGDPIAAETAAPGEAADAHGTGASDSTAGVPAGDAAELILGAAGALGDGVAARRALFPNGGLCADPVAGVWRAQKFRSSDRTWVRFVLRVRREGTELRGTITSRIWTGTPSVPEPGACTAFGFDHTWRMDARGEVDGTRVTFGSRTARLIEEACPSRDARYAPDNFTGTIEPFREVFESRNNDGAFDIDEPYTFRRVACE